MTGFDAHALTELELIAENDCGERCNSVYRTLSKKHQKGTYDMEKAIGYIERHLVLPAAKTYLMEQCSMTQGLRNTFPKSMRLQVAETIEEKQRAEFNLGNYYK
tara:strand:- start:186 stop:497 length:312 start_codon:yes stop_codon:yes gene_type:complete